MLGLNLFQQGSDSKETEEKEQEDRVEIPRITDELDSFSNP